MNLDYITLFINVSNDVDLDPYTIQYCVRRLKSEGITFWTSTLPKLSKAVLASLEKGFFERPLGFTWKRKSLRYFSKFLNKIFDQNTGLVLDEPDQLALYCLRQVCEYTYKLALPFDPDVITEATCRFVEHDDQVGNSIDWDWADVLRKRFETHFPCMSNATLDDILRHSPPRSGPGTFSECSRILKGAWYTYKSHDCSVPSRLSHVAWASRPMRLRTTMSPDGSLGKRINLVKVPRTVEYESYSELLFVPKDSRGPRTIVREPYHPLRYQMSFNGFMVSSLTRASKGRVNFRDQLVNRELAQQSSITREYATLDLKDASDSVSYSLVKHLFSQSPGLRALLSLARTSTCRLPDGSLIALKKLSGMGSGLTFPSMSLLIYLTSAEAISRRSGKSFKDASANVYVFGDDLIVPRRYVSDVMDGLRKVGLLLNPDKCFINSHFRESCGGDFFRGGDVAPIRLKLSGTDLSVGNKYLHVRGNLALIQVERHCRELVKAGLTKTSEYFYRIIEANYGPLPKVAGESPVIGRYTTQGVDYPCDEYGNYLPVRCIVPVPKVRQLSAVEQAEWNPYLQISASIKRAGVDDSISVGQLEHEVIIPRAIKYRRSRVSGFRLMG